MSVVSLNDQIKNLQQLINQHDVMSTIISTSFTRLLTVLNHPMIETSGDINELYHHCRTNLKFNQESLDECNRDIESLLKVMMIGRNSDDRITKVACECSDNESMNVEVSIISDNERPSLIEDDELTPEQLAAFNVRISHCEIIPS